MTNAPKTVGLVHNGFGGWRLWTADDADDPTVVAVPYLLAAEHERLMAERDAEIARLREELTLAAYDVLAERRRQIRAEGWTSKNDDAYQAGDLGDAAACYALSNPVIETGRGVPYDWPWSSKWWKPTSRRRDLVKAGALILAEIERLDRAALGDDNG